MKPEKETDGPRVPADDGLGGYPETGADCTLNSDGDLFMIYEARQFIGAPCVAVKRTKAGLVQVALRSDPRSTFSAPLRNVVLTPNGGGNTRHE